jgi:hypothetical protein
MGPVWLAVLRGGGVGGQGIFPEDHPQFIGIYWGVVSWPFCQQVVESSQALLQIGTVWNDYSSVSYTNLISPSTPHRTTHMQLLFCTALRSIFVCACAWVCLLCGSSTKRDMKRRG